MNPSSQLPAGFETLAPYVPFWAVDTAAARAQCRDVSGEAARRAFYEAARDLVPTALAYLDEKSLSQWDDMDKRLMRLALSFVHAALAVELQRDEEPKHARYRPCMRITRATADEKEEK